MMMNREKYTKSCLRLERIEFGSFVRSSVFVSKINRKRGIFVAITFFKCKVDLLEYFQLIFLAGNLNLNMQLFKKRDLICKIDLLEGRPYTIAFFRHFFRVRSYFQREIV